MQKSNDNQQINALFDVVKQCGVWATSLVNFMKYLHLFSDYFIGGWPFLQQNQSKCILVSRYRWEKADGIQNSKISWRYRENNEYFLNNIESNKTGKAPGKKIYAVISYETSRRFNIICIKIYM